MVVGAGEPKVEEVEEGEKRKAGVGEELVRADGESKEYAGEMRLKGVGVEEKQVLCADGEPEEEAGEELEEDGPEAADEDRKAIEERLAARYTIPVEVFSAGSEGSGGCILVSNISGFREARRRRHAPMYLMPYLPPAHAVFIKAEMNESLRALIINPELLASKVAAKRAIDAQAQALLLLLPEAEEGSRQRQQEHRARVAEGMRLAFDIITFRGHLQNRLLFAYTAQGLWANARSFLHQMCPEMCPDVPLPVDKSAYKVCPKLERTIKNLKEFYPYSEEHDVCAVSSDLLSVLALEHWNEELQRARGTPPDRLKKVSDSFKDSSKEYSLIGASNAEMVLAAMKRGFNSLVSSAIEKGHLSEGITIDSSTRASFREFYKIRSDQIRSTREKVVLNFDGMSATIEPLQLVATRLGAKGLESKCEKIIGFCKQQDSKRCKTMLSEIDSECLRIYTPWQAILDVQELFQLVERMIESQSPDLPREPVLLGDDGRPEGSAA